MLLIGSRAAQYHFPDFREPKDYDFIATKLEVEAFLSKFKYIDTSKHNKKRRALIEINGKRKSFEFDLVEVYPSNKLIYENDFNYGTYNPDLKISYAVASVSTLMMLKKCCAMFPIHWDKNMEDFLFFKKHINTLSPWQIKAFKLRAEEIKIRHQFKEMNFDVSNEKFFKKSEKFVKRVVPHDSIHYSTCFYKEPLFLSTKSDLSKAAMDENKVNQLTDSVKIQLIQEEAMALALERYIIPAMVENKPYNANLAYNHIVKKMICHYLPFFLRSFAVDNYLKILSLDIDYVSKFLMNNKEFACRTNQPFIVT